MSHNNDDNSMYEVESHSTIGPLPTRNEHLLGRSAALKANSTSTIFATGSLTNPDMDGVIISMSMVMQLQMISDLDKYDYTVQERFSIFDDIIYSNDENGKNERKVIPKLECIYKFIKDVFDCSQYSEECNIISLVYVNSVLSLSGMILHSGNWRSILLTAMLIAQKVWDDRSLVNCHFSYICPIFSTAKLNALEKRFLELLDYDVNVNGRVYAKYYFELRELLEEQANRIFSLQPLSAKDSRRLETRSNAHAARILKIKEEERRKSMDQFSAKPKNYVLS